VRGILAGLDGNSVLSFEEQPEALEWRQSQDLRRGEVPAGAGGPEAG
jgi:hypothetical protein